MKRRIIKKNGVIHEIIEYNSYLDLNEGDASWALEILGWDLDEE